MRFKTLLQYDDEIEKCNRVIDGYKKYLERHPADIVGHTNRQILEYVRDELKKKRDELAASLYYKEEKND